MSWRRRILPALLASSSLAAPMIGSGAPAYAACVSVTGAFTNSTSTPGVCITNQTFAGNVSNAGTISASGIVVTNSSIGGQIVDSGTIVGGIKVDSQSAITGGALSNAISITGPTLLGGVSNAGTITAGITGIVVSNVTSFQGVISNSGTITAGYGIAVFNETTFLSGITNSGTITASGSVANAAGIVVTNVAVFGSTSAGGGISNSGTITAPTNVGIEVGVIASNHIFVAPVTSFSGGMTNSGTITARRGGIFVGAVSAFAGGIVNSGAGTISASATNGAGIRVGLVTNGGAYAVSSFAGGITNAGMIAASARNGDGILASGVSTFQGVISNSGTISANGTHGGGILVSNVAVFGSSSAAGGIANSGSINATGTHGNGIEVGFASGSIVKAVTSFFGGISNGGTINATRGSGILVAAASTFVGGIVNSGAGTISAGNGIFVTNVAVFGNASAGGGITNAGTIASNGLYGIGVSGVATFLGGISNAGTITGNLFGIRVVGGTVFGSAGTSAGGGIVNSGTISAETGIAVAQVPTFLGGISNSGTITATVLNRNGIALGIATPGGFVGNPVTSFSGGIFNSGAINAGTNGIFVAVVSAFAGGIVNSSSGTISASVTNGAGIRVGAVINTNGAYTVSSFTGGIANAGTIAAGGSGILVSGVSTFLGGIVNSNSGTISATNGAGIRVGALTNIGGAYTVSSFAGGISNAGTISAGIAGIFLSGVSTFQGGIANAGMVAAAGTGILVVGVSTFLGGISNSSSGTIKGQDGITVANMAVFGSPGGGIINAGTITAVGDDAIQVAAVTTFLGGISNSGKITAALGFGIIVGSIAQFGSASAGGGITNSGTITAGTGIFIGSGVTFASGAAIVNSGTITGTRGTAIDVRNATSPVTIDQTGGLISGAIRLSTNADVVSISGGTIAGNVVGQGTGDTVNFAPGSGTFTYGSPFAMTGLAAASFNSGTAFVDGSIQATAIAVNNGGTAAGTGTLSGPVTVMSGGTLMPGQPLGTLTVTGSLTFNPGSFYAVRITDATSSKTLVNGAPGTATINGGTVVVTAPFATLGAHGGTTYTILTATSRTGTFAGLTVNSSGNVAFTGGMTLDYSIANEVLLNVGRGFTVLSLPSGGNGNQQSVLKGINNAILNNDTLSPGFQSLANLSGPSLLNALTQLSGEVGAGFSQGALQAGNSFLNLMLNPFVDNRGGDGGFGRDGGSAPIGFAGETAQRAEMSGAFASIDKAPPKESFAQRYGVWGAAYGGTGTVNGDPAAGSHNTSAQVYGFGGGFDYRVSPDTILGLALAGGATHWSLDQGFGSGRSDMFQAGVYGSTHWGAAYLSAAFAYSFHDVTTNRTVTVAGTDQLQGNFRANMLSERVEGGYRIASPWLAMTPYAAVQLQSLFLPAYGEGATSGSAQFAMSYAAQNQTTERAELGARFDKSWLDKNWFGDGDALVTLYSRAAWVHDFNNTATATALFQTGREFRAQWREAGARRRAAHRRGAIPAGQRLVAAGQIRRRVFHNHVDLQRHRRHQEGMVTGGDGPLVLHSRALPVTFLPAAGGEPGWVSQAARSPRS